MLRCADEERLGVVPRGGGTKLNWGNPPARADVVLSTERLDSVLAHAWADMTATVEAGCTLERLQAVLAEHGQRLAVDVLRPAHATIGGILATNDSGALRLRYGGLRDLVIGATIVLADGTVASSGGRVVKNVAGYDLQKLTTGALGTLGVVTRATFRVHPLALASRTVTLGAATVEELQGLMLAIQDSQAAPTALQARAATDAPLEMDVLLEGTDAGLEWQEATIREIATRSRAVLADANVWAAREALFAEGPQSTAGSAVAKLSILPADLAATLRGVAQAADARNAAWRTVVQATGVGWLRLDGYPDDLAAILLDLRGQIESAAGSLVIVRQPPGHKVEAWGDPGDALPLMQALKRQLDPRGTLNPGRFVGGI